MDDKKVYSVVGRVEIGTDEYRDLIEQKAEADREASDYRSRYWDEQSKRSNAEKEVDRLKKYENFVKQNDLLDKFKLWTLDQVESKED